MPDPRPWCAGAFSWTRRAYMSPHSCIRDTTVTLKPQLSIRRDSHQMPLGDLCRSLTWIRAHRCVGREAKKENRNVVLSPRPDAGSEAERQQFARLCSSVAPRAGKGAAIIAAQQNFRMHHATASPLQEIICRTPEGPIVISTYADLHQRAQLCGLALRSMDVRSE